jgi:hypothetical protein
VTSKPPSSLRRTALGLAGAVAFAAGALAGCAPHPGPTPGPTGAFASEEDAFLAAEETYSAYTAATNLTDLNDPTTFENVFAWLVDAAESSARENYSDLHAAGITRSGITKYDSFTPLSFDGQKVLAALCIDVSSVTVVDTSGNSAAPADRPSRQAVSVAFILADTPTSLAISSSTSTEELTC